MNIEKKSLIRIGCQGDVGFCRVEALPDGYTQVNSKGRDHIVAHSETGHHHVVDVTDAVMFEGRDPLRAYLRLTSDTADVVHQRSYDTHATVSLGGGPGAIWEVRRQREWDPEGERRAAD